MPIKYAYRSEVLKKLWLQAVEFLCLVYFPETLCTDSKKSFIKLNKIYNFVRFRGSGGQILLLLDRVRISGWLRKCLAIEQLSAISKMSNLLL